MNPMSKSCLDSYIFNATRAARNAILLTKTLAVDIESSVTMNDDESKKR